MCELEPLAGAGVYTTLQKQRPGHISLPLCFSEDYRLVGDLFPRGSSLGAAQVTSKKYIFQVLLPY